MENKEKIWVEGMQFKAPDENTKEKAPWIKGKISIKVPDFIKFLQAHETKGGWINIDLKKSKEKGSLYLELNKWQPKEKEDLDLDDERKEIASETVTDFDGRELNLSDIPFN